MSVARVAGRRDVGGGMTLFALDVPTVLRESYVRPGQYAHLTLTSEDGFFVLGSRERRSPWEIVLRRGGGVADLLLAAPIGLEVTASEALGAGFPMDDARGEDLIVLVTAGAIAAARAVIGRRIEDGDARKTRLVVGARTRSSVPLEDELEAMRSAGINVRIVLSRETGAGPHDQGYVQHILEREWPSLRGRDGPWVFVAGSDAMVEDVKRAARALGALPDRVVSNT